MVSSDEGARGVVAGSWVVVRAFSWSRLAVALRRTRLSWWVSVTELRMALLASVVGLAGCWCGGLLGGEAAEHVEQVGEGVDGAGGGGGVGGDLFDAQVDGAAGEDVGGGGVAEAGYEVGVGAERELEAEDGDVVGVSAVGWKGRPMWPMPQASESRGTSW